MESPPPGKGEQIEHDNMTYGKLGRGVLLMSSLCDNEDLLPISSFLTHL